MIIVIFVKEELVPFMPVVHQPICMPKAYMEVVKEFSSISIVNTNLGNIIG